MDTKFKIFELEKKLLREIGQEEITILNPIKLQKPFETYDEAVESLKQYMEEKTRERANLDYTILPILKNRMR